MACQEAEIKVNNIIREIDLNQNGFIEFSEFVMAAVKKSCLLNRDILETAFQNFDVGHTGTITADEINAILYNNLISEDDHVVERLIKLITKSERGEIDLKTFKLMMLNLI